MESIIASQGGDPLVVPSLRELPLEESPEAERFAVELLAGRLQVVLFMTGVGCKALFELLQRDHDTARLIGALARTVVVARGPKPTKALRDLGVEPTVLVPEPNTWRDLVPALLAHLEQARGRAGSAERPLDGLRVALQEYGAPSPELVGALEGMGAEVLRVPIYRWAPMEDASGLRALLGELEASDAPVVLFTNAFQVRALLGVAQEMGREPELRAALGRGVVASIGPTCSEVLRDLELPVTLEPEHPRMGHLVRAAAAYVLPPASRPSGRVREREPQAPDEGAPWHDSPFLRACRREPVPITPIWLMRQAGRYMKEYREVRRRCGFLELCKSPDLVSEVTVTAAERLGVDAAILFADILLIAEPLGLELEFNKGEGPSLKPPVREAADVGRLREVDPAELGYVYEAVTRTRADLNPKTPLIGFAGAPFTVASYLVEGGSSRNFENTKSLMYRDAGAWRALMELVTRGLAAYLEGQIAAGAQAVQLFDSWVGCLSAADYGAHVLPHVQGLVSALPTGTPVIYFGTGTAHLLDQIALTGATVVGVDWRIGLDAAWSLLGPEQAIQGNLDSPVLLTDRAVIRERARQVLREAGGRPGHIFNLGHGILPQTPVENAIALVDAVHEMSEGGYAG
jgi:uroporphyrinogen decarboxylase